MKSIILLFVLAIAITKSNAAATPDGAYKVRNILVVIDTDRLEADYKDAHRSLDPEKPTPLEHKYAFMITNNDNVVSGQATADLHIKGLVGDTVKWFGTSETNNFDIQVIVYNIKHDKSDILSEVRQEVYGKKYTYPKSKDMADIDHIYFKTFKLDASLKEVGSVDYHVCFAVYTTVNSNERQLFGYFEWDPKITVG
uniref:Inclusion body protein n=1 Tax=Cacopsylla melanoneura TaxID=428564 RepID=A0A8D8XJE4_9HEMI